MNVLSLFDGMSCGQIALKKLDIQVDNYFASEIDKYAIKVTMHNFPNTIQIGDVTKVKAENLPKIDLLIGGSPCQGFSFAGKGLNFEDPRSKLFFEFVRLLKECNPEYFFLENVKMKKEYQDVISSYLGVEPILINSALVSAQNRKRLYWTNIPNIKQPEDKNILLKDILENEVDEKYFLSEKLLNGILRTSKGNDFKHIFNENEKAPTIDTRVGASTHFSPYIITNSVKNSEAGCLKFDRTDEAKRIRKENLTQGKDYTPFQMKKIVDIDFEKMNTLTTSGNKDNLVLQINPSTESNACQLYQQNRVYDIDGISPALMAQMSCGSHAIMIPEATKKGFIEVQPGECFDAENPNSQTRRGRKMIDKSNCLMAKKQTL